MKNEKELNKLQKSLFIHAWIQAFVIYLGFLKLKEKIWRIKFSRLKSRVKNNRMTTLKRLLIPKMTRLKKESDKAYYQSIQM